MKRRISTYLDLVRELKKLWNKKVTIIPIVIGAFGTVTKRLLKGLEDLEVCGRGQTIQTTNGQNTEKNPGESNYSVRPSANADVKNSNE